IVAGHVIGLAQPVLCVLREGALWVGRQEVLESRDRHRVAARLERIEGLRIHRLLDRGACDRSLAGTGPRVGARSSRPRTGCTLAAAQALVEIAVHVALLFTQR